MALPSLTDAEVIAQLDSGASWSGSTITYSFPTSPWFTGAEANGFSPLGAEAQQAAHLAIQLWDDLVAPDFSFDSSGNGSNTDIEFAFKDRELALLQIRPFVQSRRAQASRYLVELDAGFRKPGATQVDLGGIPGAQPTAATRLPGR